MILTYTADRLVDSMFLFTFADKFKLNVQCNDKELLRFTERRNVKTNVIERKMWSDEYANMKILHHYEFWKNNRERNSLWNI